MRLALIALCVIGSLQPAYAQSKKYPPVAPDKELEEEKRSDLWESTLHPDTRPYKDLIRDAKRLIEHNTPADTKAAIEKLDAAIKRLPKEPEAYLMRGQLYYAQRDWAKCADDLGRAEDYGKVDDLTARTKARVELGNCQARAGRFTDAENTFVRASASAQTQRSELWMRLGEVRIALGKLDEAIDALTAALDADSSNALTRWLLAAAYDRARRPSEAVEHAQTAARYDASRTQIEMPTLPFLAPAEADYLNGLAYRYALPKPEYALIYFRRYVKLVPSSPWKRRADEHVRELAGIKWPAKESTAISTTTVSVDEIKKQLERPVAAMRQCLAKAPLAAFSVNVMKAGPRTSEAVRDRPIYRLPPPPMNPIRQQLDLAGSPQEELDAAKRCLEQHVAKLKLPAPKERDTYYTLTFVVVSP
ncbi:MAG TPA: tetratricopeptide repeat protein [Kofleriaceae bacterium]